MWLNRPQLISVSPSIPDRLPANGFSHEEFETLLVEYLESGGQIDYRRWHDWPDSVTRLDGYLAAVSHFSPENVPERFAMRNYELAHWMYGNSAYAIKSVLHHWPIWSVADAGAPPEAVRKGFVFLPTPIFVRRQYLQSARRRESPNGVRRISATILRS